MLRQAGFTAKNLALRPLCCRWQRREPEGRAARLAGWQEAAAGQGMAGHGTICAAFHSPVPLPCKLSWVRPVVADKHSKSQAEQLAEHYLREPAEPESFFSRSL